jgi:prepilin-type N-terminal cleavage/methylation domain-containing protein
MNWKKQLTQADPGFTLLEVLIAVTLVAAMAVGLWALFRISIRSWSRGTEFIDANQRHRTILDLVRKQMASTFPLLTGYDMQQGTAPYLIFSGNESGLSFISLNSLRFQESPGLTFVSYEIERDEAGDYALVEKETRYTGQVPDQEALAGLSKGIPIFENLSSCLFEYYDPGTGNGTPQWVREWDGQQSGQLPVAVSITMLSRDSRGNSLNRHMIVPIQAQVSNYGFNVISPFGRNAVMR